MSLFRLLIVGIIVMAAVYIMAAAVAAIMPYIVGAFIIWIAFVGIHSWLLKKDRTSSTQDDKAP